MQKKQSEWKWQWNKLDYDSQWLFTEWIYPNKLEDFNNKTVLDAGCGGGQHLDLIAPYCKYALGIELNASEIAKRKNKYNKNVKIIEGDIGIINPKKKFDIVYSIGVLHHTNNPRKSFNKIKKNCKKKGRVIVWVYSYEGNFLNRSVLEPIKKIFFLKLNKKILLVLSKIITGLLYIPIYSIYLFPIRFLPFYDYFKNYRRLKFNMNTLNVFDKLNAPQTHFIKRSAIKSWFNSREFSDVHISHYKVVSWRASGTKK